MKIYRATKGPFIERPYYETEEIEQICGEELRTAGLYPLEPKPIRIDRFIEKRFGVSPIFEELPSGILGLTRFGPQGVQEIVVSKDLGEEQTRPAERRLNTTLAHEAAHGLLHSHLFVLGAQSISLFEADKGLSPEKILCRQDTIDGSNIATPVTYDGRWWEYQANRAMGALLMPKPLVQSCLESLLEVRGLMGARFLPDSQRQAAIKLLSNVFDVNPIVAKIRLDGMYAVENSQQLTL